MSDDLFGDLRALRRNRGAPPAAPPAAPEPAAPPAAAPRVLDLLDLPDQERSVVNWILRTGDVTLEEVAAYAGTDEATTTELLETLSVGGFVQPVEGTSPVRYRAHLGSRRTRRVPGDLWRALE